MRQRITPDRDSLYDDIIKLLESLEIDIIVLAGYLSILNER